MSNDWKQYTFPRMPESDSINQHRNISNGSTTFLRQKNIGMHFCEQEKSQAVTPNNETSHIIALKDGKMIQVDLFNAFAVSSLRYFIDNLLYFQE